jgi:2-methylcitrate dehydratase PrpD
MEVEELLAEHMVGVQYQDLPQDAVEATKQHILHTVATIIGGSDSPGCSTLAELVKEWGGREESTVLVYGGRVPAVHAALANSGMAHALDYCMNDDRIHYKSSVVAVPACFAVAESVNATGEEFLTAVCLGIDAGIRIGLAINPHPSHALSWLVGGLASAMACGRIMGLNKEQMLDALGAAYCQVSHSGMSVTSPALTKRLLPGVTARGAVFAAQLAKKGFPTVRNVLHGTQGFFQTYYRLEGDLDRLTADLGKVFEVVNVGPKGYPCCRVLQAPLDATLALVRDHDIKADDVEAVTVRVNNQKISGLPDETLPEVLQFRRHPRGDVDAQFSTPWAVATAIVKRKAFIDDFNEQGIRDPEVNRMADRVTPVNDPALASQDTVLTPSIVEIKTKSGQLFSNRVDFPKGNPNNPVTMDETVESFRKCRAHAARPLSPENTEDAIKLILNLEEAQDVGQLAKLLT